MKDLRTIVIESSIPGVMVVICVDCGNALGIPGREEDSCDVCDEAKSE